MESHNPHPLAEHAQACGRLTQAEGPEGPIAPVVTTGSHEKNYLEHGRATSQHDVDDTHNVGIRNSLPCRTHRDVQQILPSRVLLALERLQADRALSSLIRKEPSSSAS